MRNVHRTVVGKLERKILFLGDLDVVDGRVDFGEESLKVWTEPK
jgi:hypothetical protein